MFFILAITVSISELELISKIILIVTVLSLLVLVLNVLMFNLHSLITLVIAAKYPTLLKEII